MSEDVKEVRGRTRIPVENCNFQWSIENFSFYTCEVGDQLTSPRFRTGSSLMTTWSLTMYPNGRKRGESEGKIGIYLTRTSSDISAHFATFKLSILSANQAKNCIIDFEHLYDKPVSGWGSFDFLDRQVLLGTKRTTLLPNDILTVSCELKTARLEDDLHFELVEHRPHQPQTDTVTKLDILSDDYRALFDNEMYSDLTLKVGSENLFVHKCILSARSCVFANMFKHKMKENLTNCLEISDMDPMVVKTMISYLYCGQLQNLDPEMAIQLYSGAERYGLKDLKRSCVDFIVSHLTLANVCDVLLLGDLHADPELMYAAKNFVYINASSVQETENWLNVTVQKPDLAFAINRAVIAGRKRVDHFMGEMN